MKFWMVDHFCLIPILFNMILWCQGDYEGYKNLRKNLLETEERNMVGYNVKLNEKEKKVNDILMKLKEEQYNSTIFTPDYINFTHHYLFYRHEMKKTTLYKFLKQMPKGVALHIHDLCVLGSEYLIRITYKAKHLYACLQKNKFTFIHSRKAPRSSHCNNWTLVSEGRAKSHKPAEFDAMLRQHLTMIDEESESPFQDPETAWLKYVSVVENIKSLVSFKPVYEEYYEDLLQAVMEDGATYAEIRSVLPELYDLEGKSYTKKDTMDIINLVTKRFKNDNPQFLGANIIYAPFAANDSKELKKQLDTANEMNTKYSSYFSGFDQIWREDTPHELGNDSAKLLAESKLNYFFHAGATTWNGKIDNYLYDAVALKTRRIGNAYALPKHQALVKRVKKKKIALEVNVISNQIFGLTFDFKIHPLANFLAQDMPVTISSDLPGLWNAAPCTEDYFIAWVVIARQKSDLRMLKQLAFNSIKYSSLNHETKKKNARKFQKYWEEFLDYVLKPRSSRRDDIDVFSEKK